MSVALAVEEDEETTEEERGPGELAIRAQELLKTRKLSQNKAAGELGISAAAFSQWLQGLYKGDTAKLEEKVKRWFDEHEARAVIATAIKKLPEWVETPTGRRIVANMETANYAPTMLVCFGGAGVGKTKACQRYAKEHNNVWLATMSAATKSLSAALARIAAAVGVRETSTKSARLEDAINHHLAGRGGLLVIDEAQALREDALEGIRAIYDANPKIGIALVGNEQVYSRMTGSRTAAFAQLFSRIGLQMDLRKPTPGDVKAITHALGIEGEEELAYLVEISERPGALRGVVLTIQIADQIAQGARMKLNARLLKAASKKKGDVA